MSISAMFSLKKLGGSSHKDKEAREKGKEKEREAREKEKEKEREAREYYQETTTPNIMSMLPASRASRTNADMVCRS